jgi:hypothetical protein
MGALSRATRHVVGAALNFGGTDEHVTFGNVLDRERTDSFSAFALARGAVAAVLVSKSLTSNAGGSGRGWHFGTQASGAIYASIANDVQGAANILDELSTSTPMIDGRYHLIGMTFDGTSTSSGLKLWADAVELTTSVQHSTLSATVANSGSLIWGAMSTALQFPYTGQSSQHTEWNKVLSGAEIAELLSAIRRGADLSTLSFAANRVGHWGPLATDSATGTITDLSSGGHNGTATNMEAGDIIPVYHHELRAA